MVNALDPEDVDFWMNDVSATSADGGQLELIMEQYLPKYSRYTNECFRELGMNKESLWKFITLAVLP